jgi:hypothetical protein
MSGMFIPDLKIFPSGSRIQRQKKTGSRIRNKKIKVSVTQKIDPNLWEILPGLFIPDPRSEFFPFRIQGSK